MDRKQIGRIGLTKAIDYFTIQGYTVSLPLNDTQWYDLIIEKNGIFETVQCKATNTKDNVIDFRETGGTSGKVYGNALSHSNLTYIFCVSNDLTCYNIPVQDLLSNNVSSSIKLNKHPNKNNQGFETYTYLI